MLGINFKGMTQHEINWWNAVLVLRFFVFNFRLDIAMILDIASCECVCICKGQRFHFEYLLWCNASHLAAM